MSGATAEQHKSRRVIPRKLSRLLIVVAAVLVTVFVTSAAASAIGVARIAASVGTPWVQAIDFGSNVPVEVRVDFTNNGSFDFVQTLNTNSSGNVNFNLGSTSVVPGAFVRAEGNGVIKELLVGDIRVEYANPNTNVVSGVSPAFQDVTVSVQQAGPPLATLTTMANSAGFWSVDFTGTYDIEPEREVSVSMRDIDEDMSSSSTRARVPFIVAGYSQYGANSLIVSGFTPGTSVRMQIDFGNDGGPLGGFDIDHVGIIDNPFGFGFDLGGFDVLRPNDHIIATGGGWTKEMYAVPLRIEIADASTDVVSGTATPNSNVMVYIEQPEGQGGPPVAELSVTTGFDGRWRADFSGYFDFEQGRPVSARISDLDGDVTSTSWRAVAARVHGDVSPSGGENVWLHEFAPGTEVFVGVDFGNDGVSPNDFDFVASVVVDNMYGVPVDVTSAGLLHPGDEIVARVSNWSTSLILQAISVDRADAVFDDVSGTGPAGATLKVSVNPPPGDPGGPPVIEKETQVDSQGNWSLSLSGEYDLVVWQSIDVALFDSEGDWTQASTEAVEYFWNVGGFYSPIVNPAAVNNLKAGGIAKFKFSVDGFRGFGILDWGYPRSQQISCGTNPVTDGGDSTLSAGKEELTYTAKTDRYTYQWQTARLWKGTCRQFVMRFIDGSYLRANFKFS
jgi:hypothetical protein